MKRQIPPKLIQYLQELDGEYTAGELVDHTGYSKSQISKVCRDYGFPFRFETRGSYCFKVFNISEWKETYVPEEN